MEGMGSFISIGITPIIGQSEPYALINFLNTGDTMRFEYLPGRGMKKVLNYSHTCGL